MKLLILLILASVVVAAQTPNQQPIKFKTWRERLYRGYKVEDVEIAKSRLAAAQDLLDKFRANPNLEYPQFRDEQETRVNKLREELKTAEAEVVKVDEMLTNPETRKAFNEELKNIFKRRNEETAAKYASSRSDYPALPRNYRISCFSTGVGQFFWVRCTSTTY